MFRTKSFFLEKWCEILRLYFENDAYDYQGGYEDEHVVQNDQLINCKEYYVSSDGTSAIWYHNGKWIVGDIFHLGTSVSSLASTDDPTCPEYTQAWTDSYGDVRDDFYFSCWA